MTGTVESVQFDNDEARRASEIRQKFGADHMGKGIKWSDDGAAEGFPSEFPTCDSTILGQRGSS